MNDLNQIQIELQSKGIIQGQRPVFIKIQKGNYPYKGKYLLTFDGDVLRFYQLGFRYYYKGKKAVDFFIKIDNLKGYHFSFFKEYAKKITFYFLDNLEFNFTFVVGYEEAYGNEANAIQMMNYLKSKGVKNQNLILSGDKRAQKTISKADQWFSKEIRNPQARKGLFR